MREETKTILLPKHDKKSWLISTILGFFIGLAVIVPGVSGSTVAIILRMYDQFLYAVGNIFKRFKLCFLFLLPIVIGAIVGFGLGFLAVQQLMKWMPFAVICLFAGLMIGSFPAVKDELKGVQMNGKRMSLLIVGACIPVAVGVYSAVASLGGGEGGANILESALLWKIVLPILVGFVLAITQVVPGLSASAILMLIGWYTLLMNNVHFSVETLTNFDLMLLLAGLAVGFCVGFVVLSKLMTVAFERARDTSYSLIVGLALGSILTMFFNADVMDIYVSWVQNGVNAVHLILGVVLLIVGTIGAYALVFIQRRHNRKKAQASL